MSPVPRASRIRGFRALCAALVAASALALLGCSDSSSESAGPSGPASAIPSGAPIYLEANVKPSAGARSNLDDVVSTLGSVPILGSTIDPGDLTDQLFQRLNDKTGADLSYDRDIAPWLGKRVGFGVFPLANGETDFVLAAESTDDKAASDSIKRIIESAGDAPNQGEEDGVSYFESNSGQYRIGVTSGEVIFAGKAEFSKAIAAVKGDGDSIASDPDFAPAVAPLDPDRLATAYVDFAKVADLSAARDGDPQDGIAKAKAIFPELFAKPLGLGLSAAPSPESGGSALSLEMSLDGGAPPQASPMIGEVPQDAFAAVALADPESAISTLVDRAESAGEQLGDPKLRPGAIDDALQAAIGASLDDLLSQFGAVSAYARGDLPDSADASSDSLAANVSVEVKNDAEGWAAAKAISTLKSHFEADSGSKVSGPSDPQATGFTAEDASPTAEQTGPVHFIGIELNDGTLSATAAANRDAAETGVPDPLSQDSAYRDSTALLAPGNLQKLAFVNLEPIISAYVGAAPSVSDAVLGGDTKDLVVRQIASKLQAAALGAGESGERTLVRVGVTLSP